MVDIGDWTPIWLLIRDGVLDRSEDEFPSKVVRARGVGIGLGVNICLCETGAVMEVAGFKDNPDGISPVTAGVAGACCGNKKPNIITNIKITAIPVPVSVRTLFEAEN